MSRWLEQALEFARSDEKFVLVTVAAVRGSAPREPGAKMIVTSRETIGTIGGGQLEYKCTQIAVERLRAQDTQAGMRKFPLGSNCGQCCGGVVDVLFEPGDSKSLRWLELLRERLLRFETTVVATCLDNPAKKYLLGDEDVLWSAAPQDCPPGLRESCAESLAPDTNAAVADGFLLELVRMPGFHVAVFGAGHVGAAVVDILSNLDASLRWIDSRQQIFPARLPPNVTAIAAAEPVREVAAMPANTFYLVMTHSHPLDMDICSHILRRTDFAYCGLIGSLSKRRRFERLLRKQGLGAAQLERLTCPIGIAGIEGKKPVEIALAVAAELLILRDRQLQSGNKDAHVRAI